MITTTNKEGRMGTTTTPSTAVQPAKSALRTALIVEDNSFIGMGLQEELQRLGHTVVGLAATAIEAAELFRTRQPDLVLMDIRLQGGTPQDDGIELTRRLLAERRCPVVIISAYSDAELVGRAADSGVFAYLIKPVTPDALKAAIDVAVHRFEEAEQLRRDKQTLTETLETRKLVERAKGILMKRMNLDEETAHRRLQLESQKRRINIAETARRVIDSEKLLNG